MKNKKIITILVIIAVVAIVSIFIVLNKNDKKENNNQVINEQSDSKKIEQIPDFNENMLNQRHKPEDYPIIMPGE